MASRAQMYKYEFGWVGDNKWRLQIWMCETYAPFLKEYFPEIEFDFRDEPSGTCIASLDLTKEEEQEVRKLLDIFKKHVLLGKSKNIDPYFEDELDMCFALDYNLAEDFITHDVGYTTYGNLEHNAKENRDADARAQLVETFANLCEIHPIYRRARIVMPIPPNPSKTFHLPIKLARELAETTGKKDCASMIRKVKETPRMQDLTLDEKKKALRGAIEINGDVEGKQIIIIDDLYQSGFTMWTVAKLLKKHGAKKVLGLACVKSWRDTDNQ
ncbi:DNA utilization protein GntX [bacterium BMS3Abin10]|nr:DNA utilization protein GntX [bacterium BMS3Abin10]GBE38593.1 DNA utilization protein GntX [bacterium BMS3Bbin08]